MLKKPSQLTAARPNQFCLVHRYVSSKIFMKIRSVVFM